MSEELDNVDNEIQEFLEMFKDCDLPNTIIIPYNETFRHLLSVIPMQLLAYELSLMNGLNPDMPRNLAKVVTVE